MRKTYSNEFKEQIVNLALNTNKSQQQIGDEYGVPVANVARWVSQYRNTKSFKTVDNMSDHEKELRKLKKENEDLKMENDILKHAALILGKR